jgi:hypothetical protein
MGAHISEYIGYLASLFLIISLIVNGDIKFRIYNSFGCICFIVYGFLVADTPVWPVILTNFILLIINIVYLSKQYNYKEKFEIVEVNGEEKLIEKFLEFYADDIKIYFPNFTKEQFAQNYNFVVLRDLVVANVFSTNIKSNGDAEVVLNYTTKKYRDYKISKFIFEKENANLKAKGTKRIVYNKLQETKHKKLLSLNGFVEEENYFVKQL